MGWGGESPVSLSHENTRLAGGLIRRMKMARGSCLAGKIKAGILGLALLGGMALPAHAGDPPKLALSGSAWLTTDYMFRSISQHQPEPRRAGRVRCDLRHILWLRLGIQYRLSGIASSSTTVSASRRNGATITFNFAGLYYTYPGANDQLDYFEALGGATWTSGAWTLGIKDYWSPDNFQLFGDSNAIRGNGRRTPGPTSFGISLRPASAAPSASSRTREMPTTTCTGMPA